MAACSLVMVELTAHTTHQNTYVYPQLSAGYAFLPNKKGGARRLLVLVVI